MRKVRYSRVIANVTGASLLLHRQKKKKKALLRFGQRGLL